MTLGWVFDDGVLIVWHCQKGNITKNNVPQINIPPLADYKIMVKDLPLQEETLCWNFLPTSLAVV